MRNCRGFPRGACQTRKNFGFQQVAVCSRLGGQIISVKLPAEEKADDVELKPKIWGDLPREILEGCVLPRLPLEAIFRFRGVCKRWNDLPSSPEFCTSCAHCQSQSVHLLLIPRMQRSEAHRMLSMTTGTCNPLTKEWKPLPTNPLVENWPLDDKLSQWWQRRGGKFVELSQSVLAMRVDRRFNTFQVFIIGNNQWKDKLKSCIMQLYDSKSHSWKLLAEHDVSSPIMSGVFSNDLFYIVCNKGTEDFGHVHMKLATYNVLFDGCMGIDLHSLMVSVVKVDFWIH